MSNFRPIIIFITLMLMLSCSSDDDGASIKDIGVKVTGQITGDEPAGRALTTISFDNFGTPQQSDGIGSYKFVLANDGRAKSLCQVYFLSGGGPCVVSNINILITDNNTGEILLNMPVIRDVAVNNSLDEQSCRGFEFNYYIETGEHIIRYF